MRELEQAAYQLKRASAERDRVYAAVSQGRGRLHTNPADDAYGRAVRRLIAAALALDDVEVAVGEE